jgi:hypothetical protein
LKERSSVEVWQPRSRIDDEFRPLVAPKYRRDNHKQNLYDNCKVNNMKGIKVAYLGAIINIGRPSHAKNDLKKF